MEDKNLTPEQLKLILDRLDESEKKLTDLIKNVEGCLEDHLDTFDVRLDNMSARLSLDIKAMSDGLRAMSDGLSLDIKAANSHLDTVAGGLSADIREVRRMGIIIAVIGVPIAAASYTYIVSELSKYW